MGLVSGSGKRGQTAIFRGENGDWGKWGETAVFRCGNGVSPHFRRGAASPGNRKIGGMGPWATAAAFFRVDWRKPE